MAILASDNFTRADANPISGDWSTVTGLGACQIVSDLVEPTTIFPNRSASFYNGISWPNDQYSEVTLANAPIVAYSAAAVRCSASGGYAAYVIGNGTNLVYLQTLAGSTFETFPLTPSIGDVIRLSVMGNVLTITQNGNLIGTYTDSSATFVSGSSGMAFVGGNVDSDAQISLWTGGDPVEPVSISPAVGPRNTTLNVIVNGTGFDATSTIAFSGTGITVNSYSVQNATTIIASITISNSATASARTVTITTGSGTGALSNAFTVKALVPATAGIIIAHFRTGISTFIRGSEANQVHTD